MPAIHVNGAAISEAQIAAEMQHHPAAAPEEAYAEAARALVIRALLLNRAAQLGLQPEPLTGEDGRRELDDDALIRVLLEHEVKTPEPDEASCHRYYQNNAHRFRSPDIFEASHILFAADRNNESAYRAALREAEAVLAALKQQPGQFAGAARRLSACSSASNGGNLGQLTRGTTTPEFETFLVALEDGQLCPVPIQTRYGVHILKLERRIEGRQLPFEAAASQIAAYLGQAVWRRAVAQYIRALAASANIEGVDLGATSSPLMQ